jgi:NADPH2:quinone reductase
MKAINLVSYGGAEQLRYTDIPEPVPAAGQVLVKIAAAGVNFIDIYQREGLYPVNLPYTPGLEGAGTVTRVGTDVTGFRPGDRVAFSSAPGAYAEYTIVAAEMLIKLPDDVDFRQAAAVMLQGMTAYYLARRTYPLKPGDSCLIHAAAGGVGLLLIQIAKRSGATVYGTVSTEHKAGLARAAGADEVILYSSEDFETRLQQLTGGRGVNVVYDSVGQSTFDKGLNCLRPLGYMVLFGQSSGPVSAFDPAILNKKGSLFLTRPSLFHYISERRALEQMAGKVLQWVAAGELQLRIEHTYDLRDAAAAQRDLEARKTTGKVLLLVG